MVGPATVTSIAVKTISLIKKYWKLLLVALFIIILLPTFIVITVINILFPQVSKEEFKIYKSLTEETDISWASFMAYDVVRLDNYLKENNPNESIFNLLKINFTEYEIIETEKVITKIVDGQETTETIIEKEYIAIRELELESYAPVKELLKSLNYVMSEENMTVKNSTDFLEALNEKEEYEIEISILTDEEISKDFDDNHKEWFFALMEILPLLDPTSEFDPDEFIIPETIENPDIPSIWPASGTVTSEFGEVRKTDTHKGIDIANGTGTLIKSTANGIVIAVGTSGGFGKRVMIYHGTDDNNTTYVTVYAHLSRINVSVGENG